MQQQLKIRHMWEACSLGHASSCKESGKPSSQDVLVFQPKNLVSSTREFWAELKAVKEKYKFVAPASELKGFLLPQKASLV